jgi:hypothetical protein
MRRKDSSGRVALHRLLVIGTAAWIGVSGVALPAPTPRERPARIDRILLTGPHADRDVDWFVAPSGQAPRAVDRTGPARVGWQTTVAITEGAQLVGFDWSGPAEIALSLRSHDAGGWSQWTEVHPDTSAGEDQGAATPPTLGPVWVGNGVDRVQVRVAEGSPADLGLSSVTVEDPPDQPLAAQAADAAVPAPGIISRDEWGALPWNPNDNPDCTAQPAATKARYAIIHHTVNANNYSAADAYAMVRGIQQFHVYTNGWCDIAYNFLVDRFGRVFEGRAGGVDRGIIGGHARGFNTGSIGVSMLGDFSSLTPPAATEDAITRLLAWKFALHGIDAGGHVWVTSRCPESSCKYQEPAVVLLPTIVGHRDVGVTACPGGAGYPMLARLRANVAPIVLKSGPFHPLPGWTPQSGVPRVLSLDAFGGLHPGGAATSVPHDYFPWAAVARGIAGTSTRGYVVDGSGGLHAYGTAEPATGGTGWWPNADIVRGVALGPTQSSGYVLDWWGGLHPFGGAPKPTATGYWPGRDVARDIVTLPGGTSGYVLESWGGLHPFGGAPGVGDGPYWYGWDIARAVALRPDGPGGYVLDGWGGVHPFGGAPSINAPGYRYGADVFRDLVMLPGGVGYAVDADGVIWPVGNAPSVNHSLTWEGISIARGVVGG